MKTITFSIHYVGGMNDAFYSRHILIGKPKTSITFSFDEQELEELGIQFLSQLIQEVKTANRCVEALLSDPGMQNFSVETTYIKQMNFLLGFNQDKALKQIFKDFHTKHVKLLHFFVAGGGSVECDGYRFMVHSNEEVHKNMPHVHVMKDNENVRYSLVTLKRIDPCSRDYLRDEKKKILPALKKHLTLLQKLWAASMGGYRPPEFDFDSKQYYPES